MKALKFLKNSAGISMVEVMMAVSVMGGLSLTVAQLMKNTSENTKQNEAKQENVSLKGLLQDTLNNTTACVNTFGTTMTPANVTALSAGPTASVSIPNVKDKVNTIKYSTTSTNIQPLTITSMSLTNYSPTAFTGDFLVNATFKKSTNNIVMVKPIRIPINFSFNGTTLTACSTMAVGGEWMLGGNAGTVDGTDYLGTSDNVALNFRVNAQESGRIDNAGQTFLGYQAGRNLPYGTSGTAFGYLALSSDTGSGKNSAFGGNALRSNSSGYQNTAIGDSTLQNNSIGAQNTAVGNGALMSNTSGIGNTSLGYSSMGYATSGSNNTAVGNFAVYTTSGSQNTGVGSWALYRTSGSGNAALGANAGLFNSSGSYNLYLGNGAYGVAGNLSNKLVIETIAGNTPPLIGGDFSTREVDLNGRTVVNSNSGTAGMSALTSNITMANAGSETNAIYANHNATGVTGVAVGLRAQARNPVYGSTGRLYGVKASAEGGTLGHNYGVVATSLGGAGIFASDDGSMPNAANTYVPGWPLNYAGIFKGNVVITNDLEVKRYVTIRSNLAVIGDAYKTLGGPFMTYSDRRLKKNIKELNGALDRISKLRPVNFDWKNPQGNKKIISDTGFIAQDVEKFFPEWVTEQEAVGDDLLIIPKNQKARMLNLTTGFYAYIVKGIQELNEEVIKNKAMLKMMQEGLEQKVEANTNAISLLEKEVKNLQTENALLRERLERIEKKLLK